MTSDQGRYRGKTAVVTGAASGIGRAIVQRLLSEGALVVANDVDSEALIALDDDRVVIVQGDVRDTGMADRLTAQAMSLGEGRIDALFNNAGIGSNGPTLDIDAAEWRRVMGVNVDAAVEVVTSVGQRMVEQGGGAILNTASVAGTHGLPSRAPYVVSKHAVVGLTRSLAVEWGRCGIRVNALCPGFTETGMSARLKEQAPEYWASREAVVPLRRAGIPREQAAVALFLNSDDASYVTGLVAEVDGGTHALYAGYAVERPADGTSTS